MDRGKFLVVQETPIEWAKRQKWNGLDKSYRLWNEEDYRLQYMLAWHEKHEMIGFLSMNMLVKGIHDKIWVGIEEFENELKYLCFQEGLT